MMMDTMSFKKENNKSRYCVQHDDHSRMLCSVLCSLMEHQSLVDIAIRCGNNTLHAHKCILAANSPYFRDELEKNSGIEQIIINGLDFAVVKSLVEFMYCGETNIMEENFKYMIAASKLFQIRGIQALAADNHYRIDENVQIPAPLFLSKKPKYSSTYLPVNNISLISSSEQNFHRKLKRKYMKTEAEKACAKEAAASRLALEALQKELASTNQISSFVIEESCAETTVENFIPHGEETFIDNLNNLEVPLEVVNYTDLNSTVLNPTAEILNVTKPNNAPLEYNNINSPRLHEAITDKLRQIFGGDVPANVEIMFKTNDGNFMSVTDEVLQNITKDSLQYQVIDEHGHAGEVQQLTINSSDPSTFNENMEIEDPIAKYVNPIENIANPKQMDDISSDQSILEAIIEDEKRENQLKFVSDADLASMEDGSAENQNLEDSFQEASEKLKPINLSSSERSFCDEFLNNQVELINVGKDIYSSDISCLENVDPLNPVSENFLNNIPIVIGQTVVDDQQILKKIRLSESMNGPSEKLCYSPADSRTLKENGLTIDVDEIIDVDADNFEITSEKLVVMKKK